MTKVSPLEKRNFALSDNPCPSQSPLSSLLSRSHHLFLYLTASSLVCAECYTSLSPSALYPPHRTSLPSPISLPMPLLSPSHTSPSVPTLAKPRAPPLPWDSKVYMLEHKKLGLPHKLRPLSLIPLLSLLRSLRSSPSLLSILHCSFIKRQAHRHTSISICRHRGRHGHAV